MLLFVTWAVMIAGEWIVAVIALLKVRKKYPWFTSMVCVMAVKSVLLYYMRVQEMHTAYFYSYYRLELLVDFLQLGATVEVFGTLFRPFWTVPKNSLITLVLATTTTLCVATKANLVFSRAGEIAFYQTMDKVVSCAMAISLSAVLLFANHFEMPFRSRLKGITIGLYVMAVTSTAMSIVIANFGGVVPISFALLPVVAHYFTLTTWSYYLARNEELAAVLSRKELEGIEEMLDQFKLALGNTPTSCGLTLRKEMGKARGEQKAKMVKKNG